MHETWRGGSDRPTILNLVQARRERGIGLRTTAGHLPIDTSDEGPTASIDLALLASFGEVERAHNRELGAHGRAVMESKAGFPGAHRSSTGLSAPWTAACGSRRRTVGDDPDGVAAESGAPAWWVRRVLRPR